MKYQKLYDLVKYRRGIIKEIETPYISDRTPSKIQTDCAITHLTAFFIMDIMTSCKTTIQLENTKNWALNITKNGNPFINKKNNIVWYSNFINEQYKQNMWRLNERR